MSHVVHLAVTHHGNTLFSGDLELGKNPVPSHGTVESLLQRIVSDFNGRGGYGNSGYRLSAQLHTIPDPPAPVAAESAPAPAPAPAPVHEGTVEQVQVSDTAKTAEEIADEFTLSGKAKAKKPRKPAAKKKPVTKPAAKKPAKKAAKK